MKELKCINNSPMFFGGTIEKMKDINDISEVLKIDEVYTINHIDESGWFNRIYLNEIPDIWFGREAFEEI